MKFKNGKIISTSISPDNTAIQFLNIDNNVVGNKEEEFDFHFSDITLNLKPYIDLISDEEVDIKIHENKLVIKDSTKKTLNLFFCDREFTNHFTGEDSSDNLSFFYDNTITDDFISKFNDIKKIAFKFGKVYFIVKDGKLYIEATDKLNSFSNGVKIEFEDIDDSNLDFYMCFDFKNLNYIVSAFENENDDFLLKCTYNQQHEAGMILFQNKNGSEKYFLTSKSE